MWMRDLPFVTTVVEFELAPLFLFRGFLFRGFFLLSYFLLSFFLSDFLLCYFFLSFFLSYFLLCHFLLSFFLCHTVITSFRAFSEVLFRLLFNFQILYTFIDKKTLLS